jgi:hypothetical protein
LTEAFKKNLGVLASNSIVACRLIYIRLTSTQGRSSHEHPTQGDAAVVPRASSSADPRSRELSGVAPSQNPENQAESIPLYSEEAQQYDERGHPFNPESRAYGKLMRLAQNDVLSVIGVVEKSEDFDPVEHGFVPEGRITQASEEENLAGEVIAIAGILIYDAATWWLGAFTNRLLVRCHLLEMGAESH